MAPEAHESGLIVLVKEEVITIAPTSVSSS
jgi:hypothetical protein